MTPQQWASKVYHDPLVRIQRCGDPRMWYIGHVGQLVHVYRVTQDGLWAVETSGHTNIIRFEDVEPPAEVYQPTNREDAAAGDLNAIRHIAYAEGYRDGKAEMARLVGGAPSAVPPAPIIRSEEC